jgi:hypothetical protein
MADDLANLLFIGAVFEAGRHRDKRLLVELLRSDHPLTAEDKRYLADFLDGKIRPRRGRPRAQFGDAADDLDRAVHWVRFIKKKMRQHGRAYRIHDEAISLALELLQENGFDVPEEEKLRTALRRPLKRPRKKVAH